MNDIGFWQGIAVGIVLFVILPGVVYWVWLWRHIPRAESFDFIGYNDAIRPLYTTRPAPLHKYLPEPRGELRWYDDTGILAIRDWDFAQDVYLADGTVRMIDTVSKQIHPPPPAN